MKLSESRKVRQFILEQTKTHRLILLLHYSDNLTPQEIGLVLNISEPTVRKQLGQLQQQIQQQIQPQLLLGQAAYHAQSPVLGLTGTA